MRFALITGEYHRRGGFPRHAADLAVGLRRIGHDVTVYAMEDAVETTPWDDGIRFETYRWIRKPLLAHMATHPWTAGRVARRIASEFDAVVSIGIPCRAPVVLVGPGTHRAWYVRTRRSLPVRSARRWLEAVRPFHRIVLAWERAMLAGRHPRLVVVPDTSRAGEYVDDFDFPSERIAFVPYAVNPDEFTYDGAARARVRRELSIPDGVPMLLNVARRGRQKGLDVLVDALDRLGDRPFVAVFAGDGSASSAIRSATSRLRESGRVRLLGRVPEVRSLYSAADLFVFPSRWDPWGLAVTEALASGLPVLCSRDIGAAAAIRPGSNGDLLDDPEDADEIAGRISELIDDIQRFDRSSVARSVAPYGLEAVAARFAEAVAPAPSGVSPARSGG